MNVRRAEFKDIQTLKDLLLQVLNIHAEGRPDYFVPNTTKYTNEELEVMISDDLTPIFVAVDEQDEVYGYAMCIMQERKNSNNMTDMKTLYIDDLCVRSDQRGKHIGDTLFQYVKLYAKENDCYNVTLNVWDFNISARRFYEKEGLKPLKTIMETILEEK